MNSIKSSDSSNNSVNQNEVQSPPNDSGKKPPAYAGDPQNPNDPDFEKNQPQAKM